MSRDTQTILARAALIGARERAQQALAAARGQGGGTQEPIAMRGAIEERGLGRQAPPIPDPTAYDDAQEAERRAELRQAVEQAVEFHRQAVQAQLRLQGPYLAALQGHGNPATAAQDRRSYEQAERAVAMASQDEREARVALSQFEQEAKRRGLAREHAAIAARSAARETDRDAAHRGRLRGHVAAVLGGAGKRQEDLVFGRRIAFKD